MPLLPQRSPVIAASLHDGGIEVPNLASNGLDCPLAAFTEPVRKEKAAKSLEFLRKLYKERYITSLVRSRPEILSASLEEWHQFLTGYGLSDEAAWRVFKYSSGLLGPGPSYTNTPYNAGSAIMFLKSFGWTDEEVLQRVLPCYPEVLAASPEQLQGTVEFLRSRNFDDEAIARVVRTFPPLLAAPYQDGLLQLIDRIRASAHNKYVVSGSYHV